MLEGLAIEEGWVGKKMVSLEEQNVVKMDCASRATFIYTIQGKGSRLKRDDVA